jgi:hypothetical protein
MYSLVVDVAAAVKFGDIHILVVSHLLHGHRVFVFNIVVKYLSRTVLVVIVAATYIIGSNLDGTDHFGFGLLRALAALSHTLLIGATLGLQRVQCVSST